MRVLLACEFSGVVRRAFRALGHDAWSCDILPAEDGDKHHFQADILTLFNELHGSKTRGWDLMIAFPPCTHLAVSGARWFHKKRKEQKQALNFVRFLMDANIPRIAIENPVSIIATKIRKPDQTIQPHEFGHPEFKRTCLWLKGLPKLVPTHPLQVPVKGTDEWVKWNRVHRASPGPDRWKERSRTYTGIAAAMAWQWGTYIR
jgi:site-specific DNA-cytosine methylase